MTGSPGEPGETARSRHKCTATTVVVWGIVTGMAGDLERLTRDYWRAVQRARRMGVPEIGKLIVLADVEATHRAARAAIYRKSTSSR